MNVCDKFYWIKDHPAFINSSLKQVELDIDPHMVCPTTNRIEEFHRLNTKHQLWVEVMVPHYDEDEKVWTHTHDWNLDTGGDTWEEMIEKLFDLVVEHYGSYTDEDVDKKNAEVYGYRISKATLGSKIRTLKVKWNLNGSWTHKWSNDMMDEEKVALFNTEAEEVNGTIKALTEYRKTCNISEYEEVDAEMERNKFIQFEQQLSLQTGIDLVRK